LGSRARRRASLGRRPARNSSNPGNLGGSSAVYGSIRGTCETLRRWQAGPHLGSARGEKEEALNRLATCLQLACNLFAAMAIVRHSYGAAPVALGGHDLVPSAERHRCCGVSAPPGLLSPGSYSPGEWLVSVLMDALCSTTLWSAPWPIPRQGNFDLPAGRGGSRLVNRRIS